MKTLNSFIIKISFATQTSGKKPLGEGELADGV